MQELAEAMSLKPTAVYHYFRLQGRTARGGRSEKRTRRHGQTVFRARDGGVQTIRGTRSFAFVESLTRWAEGRRHEASLLLHGQPLAEGAGRDGRPTGRRGLPATCVTDLVRRGQAQGSLKGDVDPELASAAILGAVAAVTSPTRDIRGRDGRVLPSLVLAGFRCND